MAYFMTDLMGETVDQPDENRIREIISGLENADDEHPDVALSHESGWSLSVFSDKTLLWENVEDSSVTPREVTLDSWDAVVGLLLALSRGDIAEVEQADWS